MSTTVYAMGRLDAGLVKFSETLSVVAKNAVGGGVTNYVTGYGPENLVDANQATFLRGYHNGGKVLQLIPTITYQPLTGSSTTSLMQSVVLINVSSDVAAETDYLEPYIYFTDGIAPVSYALTGSQRPDGKYDFVWSGAIPTGKTSAWIEFNLAGLSSTTYVQIGQMMASFYNQAYVWPCTANNTINTGDSVIAERNIDQIQTIGGQRFDKLLFQRYIWSGELTTTDLVFMGHLQWWQAQDGIYLQSGEWGYRAPYVAGLYGKIRLGSMADEVSDPTVYRVPFEFQENPA